MNYIQTRWLVIILLTIALCLAMALAAEWRAFNKCIDDQASIWLIPK